MIIGGNNSAKLLKRKLEVGSFPAKIFKDHILLSYTLFEESGLQSILMTNHLVSTFARNSFLEYLVTFASKEGVLAQQIGRKTFEHFFAD